MPAEFWIELSERDRSLLTAALSNLQISNPSHAAEIETICLKLLHAGAQPLITVGVYGGQVQWVQGNPFPIRICDYDGETEELTDLDAQDQRCRIWFEPADGRSQTGERSR
jgi:hypothetical protein